MRLDQPSRAFAVLLASGAIAYVVLGMAACAVLGVVGYRLAVLGPGAFAAPLVPGIAFLAAVGFGTVLGAATLVRQLSSTRRLRARVASLRVRASDGLLRAADSAGIAGGVDLVEDPAVYSFVYGLLRPRVVVSSGLVTGYTSEELCAVMAHERYHVRALDPLKVVVARMLLAWLYFVPALRTLERRYLAGRELAADRGAVLRYGTRPLASALFKAVRGPGWPEMGTAAAIGGSELLDARVAQLEGERQPVFPAPDRGSLIVSVVGVGALAMLFGAAVVLASPLADLQMPMGMPAASGVSVLGVGACVLFWGAVAVLAWRLVRGRRTPVDTTNL